MDPDDTRDPDAPPSAEEVAEAEELRAALEAASTGERDHRASAGADFARAVSLAHGPRPLAEGEHRTIVAQAIARGEARRARSRRRRYGATAAIASALALAAAVALLVRAEPQSAAPALAAASIEPLVPVRSTQPLFREPFAKAGGESARIDRIATSRARDLRDNRFAAWGVR